MSHKADKRKARKRAQNRSLAGKMERLAGSTFGRYLIYELRRAGTVQALEGHTADTLAALTDLRARCVKASGFEEGKPTGAYELSHIAPVSSKVGCLGLLHPSNLAIAPREFNRRHSNKSPTERGVGLMLSRSKLTPKWALTGSESGLEVLRKARQYLGLEFDMWLKSHVIKQTQRIALVKKLRKAGFHEYHLDGLGIAKLRALAEEAELDVFDLSLPTEDVRIVLAEELIRLNRSRSLAKTLQRLADAFDDSERDWLEWDYLGPSDERVEFQAFVIEQALRCMHGIEYELLWKDRPLPHFLRRSDRSVL